MFRNIYLSLTKCIYDCDGMCGFYTICQECNHNKLTNTNHFKPQTMKFRSIVYAILIFCIMYVIMSFAAFDFEVTNWNEEIRFLYVVFSVVLSAIIIFIAWDKVHYYIHKDDIERILIDFHSKASDVGTKSNDYSDFVDFVDKFIKDIK